MLTLNKTKAALPSCQCHYKERNQTQHTRPYAGGQSLTVPANTGALNSPQWGELLGIEISADPNVLHWRALAAAEISEIIDLHRWWKLVSNRVANLQLAICTRQGYTPSAQTYKNFVTPVISPDLGRLIFNRGRNSAYRDPDIGYHFLSASLAFLRCRRLISHLAAVTKKPAVLSPSSLSRSMSSMTSWGILTVVICDFAFFAPVAIAETPCVRCMSVYAKEMRRKGLRCISLWANFKSEGEIHLESAKPGSASTLTGPLTTNVIASNEAAMKDLITHPQGRHIYIWRFLALNRHDKKAKPCRLSVEASTEREARCILAPHFILSLAVRLPAPEELS
ncbi:Ash protein family protein [Kosakonia arachidis]|uniref:Ash protein family protein n=3 Tax=Kosakonia arachidis TaxID=551989 RepID=A0A1I7BFT8_9ENTR|nr:Ash protein family protein [Kosakonia arachidis]